jgi:hypothetical protein
MLALNKHRTALLTARPRGRNTVPARWSAIAVALGSAAAAGATAVVAAYLLLPAAMVLPVVAAGLIVSAGMMALIAWAAPREVGAARLIYWDFAGALTLIGFCAALFGEAEQAVALMERDR